MKRGPSLILCAALLGAAISLKSAVEPPAAAAGLIGDVNGDGDVTQADVDLIANYLVRNSTSLPHPENADVNQDGKIDVVDALMISQFVHGIRASLGGQPPQIIGSVPINSAQNVPITQMASVFFLNPISSKTITPATLSLIDVSSGQAVPVTFTFTQTNLIVTMVPQSPLASGRTFQIVVSTGITDRAGGLLPTAFSSQFTTVGPATLTTILGDMQVAPINSVLPSSVVIQAVGPGGLPLPKVPVNLQVLMGNGYLVPSHVRNITLTTDDQGQVSTQWMLGGQVATQTVIVSGTGFLNSLTVKAFSQSLQAVTLRVVSGNSQNVTLGETAKSALVVKAMDAGGNGVAGTTVTFTVTQGQGNFAGQASSATVTNSSGTTWAYFTAGISSGTVQVQAVFDGITGQPPVFSMNALPPQPSTQTAIVGTVIDAQTLKPIPNIYIYLNDNPSIWVWSDQNGAFRIIASSGPHIVTVDAFRSGIINGNLYAEVSFPMNAVQGQDNSFGMPVILPELDQQSYIDVSDTQGGTLTMRSNPAWQLYVAPGQAHFRNGTTTGRLYVSAVPADKIPMPMSEGKSSRFFDTIQPPDVVFDPPAQVTFPNADNEPAGTVTDIFTLNYANGAFLKTGRGKVSEDGRLISSLPGQGITQGGWHSSPPPVPPASTSITGVAPNCGSQFIACGKATQLEPNAGRFLLPGIPLTCNPSAGTSPPDGSTGGLLECVFNRPPPPFPIACVKQRSVDVKTYLGAFVWQCYTTCFYKCQIQGDGSFEETKTYVVFSLFSPQCFSCPFFYYHAPL